MERWVPGAKSGAVQTQRLEWYPLKLEGGAIAKGWGGVDGKI